MKKKTYDVLIIGGGIAGIYCAITLARGGKTVALVEREKLGGTGLRWGALPVKKALDHFKVEKNYNLSDNWYRDIMDLENMINLKVQDENIDIYYGNGGFQKDRTFIVNETLISSEYIVIATGTRPSSLSGIPIDGHKIISHKEAIDFQNPPQNIIILGGNVEGVEFAAVFSQMGVKVTLIEKELSLLLGNDEDLVEPIENNLIKNGVKIIKGQGARESIVMEDKVKIILENGKEVEGEKVLVTFLRQGNFPKGIENLNIKTDENRIYVDENLETHERNVFAIGDINGKMGMAHVGLNQGIQVAEHILHGDFINTNYDLLPRAVFTFPEMAGLGKQEWELDKDSYKVGYCYFKDTWRGWSKDIEDGYIKVIVDLEDNIIGIWMIGKNVSEYIGPLGILMNKGLKTRDIKSNLIINPSLMEGILEAILKIAIEGDYVKQAHIMCEIGDISKHIVLAGDPNRILRIGEFLEDCEEVAYNREFRIINGKYRGVPITAASTGIGGPSTAIAMEELIACGGEYFIRVGSGGAIQPNVRLGDLVIATAAIREDGTTKMYIGDEYPAVADVKITNTMIKICQDLGYKHHFGLIRSHDSFYTDNEEEIMEYWNKRGVLSSDMETSTIFVLAGLRRVRAASVLNTVVEYKSNLKDGVGDYASMALAPMEGEKREIILALKTLYALAIGII